MLRKTFLLLIFFILLWAAAFYYGLTFPWLAERLLPLAVHWTHPQVRVEKLDIGYQECAWPRLVFEDIEGKIYWEGTGYIFDADALFLEWAFFREQILGVHVRGANLYSVDLTGRDISFIGQLKVQQETYPWLTGRLRAGGLEFMGYSVSEITAPLEMWSGKLRITPFHSQFYGGSLGGEILLEFTEDIPYSITLELRDVQLAQLRELNEAVFSQVSGHADGTVAAKGDLTNLTYFLADFNLPEQGAVNAVLFQQLMEYIPQSEQKTALKTLVQTGGTVPVDKADVKIERVSDQQLIVDMDLLSRKLNINPIVTLEVNIEGGMLNALKQFVMQFE